MDLIAADNHTTTGELSAAGENLDVISRMKRTTLLMTNWESLWRSELMAGGLPQLQRTALLLS
jgi:hypothetical protein